MRERVYAFASDAGGGAKMNPQHKPILFDHFGENCSGDVIFFRPGKDMASIVASTRGRTPTRPAGSSPSNAARGRGRVTPAPRRGRASARASRAQCGGGHNSGAAAAVYVPEDKVMLPYRKI